jgi:CDP-diacylglycerol--glycerol-3-phosphate 3-phosphatidyltransferase
MLTIKGKYAYFHDFLFHPLIKILPNWLRPNHITFLRMVLTPFVLTLLWFEYYKAGVPLFIFTALTDALDGAMARIKNQITEWGIFFDPVADKLLIGGVLLLVAWQNIPQYLILMLIAVEASIVAFGAWSSRDGQIRMANNWGKAKMFTEVLTLTVLLFSLWFSIPELIYYAELGVIFSVVLALISLFTYSL